MKYTDAHTMVIHGWLDELLDIQEECDTEILEEKIESLADKLQTWLETYSRIRGEKSYEDLDLDPTQGSLGIPG